MSNSASLIEKIKQLSSTNQERVAQYVAFLQWQEQQHKAVPQSWSFSFIESFKQASIYATEAPAGMDVSMATATVQGDSRAALWAHPPVTGQTVIEYHVPIPKQVTNLRLRLSFGIRDGAKIDPDNLVAFAVRVNGLRVWGEQSNALQWHTIEIPLNIPAGDIAKVAFTTEALNGHQWTWAVWGGPELRGQLGSSSA